MKSNNNSITIGKNGKGILAEMTVAAGTDRVWQVLTSFEEMPAYLSGLSQSKVLKTEGNYRLVEQMTKVGIPLLTFSFRVLMDVIEDRPFLHFNQRRGSFASFRGHWRIEAASRGNGTRIRYYLEARLAQRLEFPQLGNPISRMIRQNLLQLATWIDNSET